MAFDGESMHVLTKYEASRIIGIRASQLSQSAPVLSVVPPHLQTNFMYIATKELIDKKLDIKIRRPLPHDKFYEVSVQEMLIPPDVYVLENMLNVAKAD